MALKGSAALLELYADRGHRSLVDLDILVPHPQLPVLVEALTQEGYRSRAPATGAEAEAVGLRRGDDITLLRPGGQLVELHTTLGIPAAKPEEIWSRARTIASGGVPIGVLCPTHFLIHTAVHYLKHLDLNFAPLKGLIDIVLAVRKYGGELDWEDFWATATRWEVGDRVSLVMATLNHHWGLGVPGVPEGVEPLSAEVLVYGRPDVAERRAAHLPGVYLSRVQAAAELKGFRSRGRYLFRLLFPEPENMRHRYGVPEGRPLLGAYLRHPFTLAGRLAAGLGALAWRRARGLGKRR